MRRLLALLLLAPLVACGGADDTVDVPRGVTFRVEQARQDLQGRNFELQVVNRSPRPITVTHVELSSGRLGRPSVYEGPAVIPSGVTTNLTMAMSRARCGTGIDARAEVTYQVAGGRTVRSVVRPKDHYGSVALFMRRDCAESTVAVAIDKTLTVRGTGSDSVLQVGLTFSPKDAGGPVTIGPIDGTTLLKPTADGNIEHTLRPGAGPYRAVLDIIPNRCDVHVVAEDRTGATMPLHVRSKASGAAFFYLRFDEAQKAQVFDFIARHCGFGVEQDPLLAP
jgi:hypothetical protein